MTSKQLANLLGRRSHVWLDVACGPTTPPEFIGMAAEPGTKVEVVHDYRKTPWPFPAETFTRLIMTKVVERLPPDRLFPVMNEAWRILKPSGLCIISTPFAGSWGAYADPMVIHAWNEGTPRCFDPEDTLYHLYKPKPWKVEKTVWQADANLEIILRKRGNGAD